MTYRFQIAKIRDAFEIAKAEANPMGWPAEGDIAWIKAIQFDKERDRAFWTAVRRYAADPAAYAGKTMSVAKTDVIPMGLAADKAPF